eukprot:4614214-Ditylum_brightwellii.AAC.1
MQGTQSRMQGMHHMLSHRQSGGNIVSDVRAPLHPPNVKSNSNMQQHLPAQNRCSLLDQRGQRPFIQSPGRDL